MPPADEPHSTAHGKPPHLGQAVRWAYVMNWADQTIAALVVFVLAGFLGPTEFGVAAMAMIFAGFIDIFLDQGLSTALVQRHHLEPEHYESVFWMLMVVSLALMGLTLALSGWWAGLNDVPNLELVIDVLALRLPLGALSQVHTARLQRSLEFRHLAVRNSGAAILAGLLAIALAAAGWGVWALVAQQLCREIVATILVWRISPWRPRVQFSLPHFRELLGFSGANLAAKLGVFTIQQADALLIGLFFGPKVVGAYRFATRIVLLVLKLLTRSLQTVSLPQLSRLQHDPAAFRSSALKLMRLSTAVTLPAFAILAAVSGPLMATLGPEWAEAAGVLTIFCAFGFLQSVTQFSAPILQATSRPFLLAAFTWVQGLINVVVFLVLARWLAGDPMAEQLSGLASGRVVAGLACSLPIFVVITLPRAHVNLGELARTSTPALVAAIAGGAASLLAVREATGWNLPHWGSVLIAVAPGGLVAGSILLALEPDARALVGKIVLKWRRHGVSPKRASG